MKLSGSRKSVNIEDKRKINKANPFRSVVDLKKATLTKKYSVKSKRGK